VVNKAHRIVNIADAGSVLATEELYALLADEPGLSWQALRARELKDLGRVNLYAVARTGAPSISEDRRSGVRWRRLSELRQELEALRARGEAVLGSIAVAHAHGVMAAAEAAHQADLLSFPPEANRRDPVRREPDLSLEGADDPAT
ncbi:MAG TPA: hypothetical protein VGS21_10215, partial [Acidimicrobiales bacterium]|nr:hypothetical protein [Acidimicrobiales bacterium]